MISGEWGCLGKLSGDGGLTPVRVPSSWEMTKMSVGSGVQHSCSGDGQEWFLPIGDATRDDRAAH